MPYSAGTRLPFETASKLGHLAVIRSPWVQALVADFDSATPTEGDPSKTVWQTIDTTGVLPLRTVWAVDGSFVPVITERKPPKEVAFVKTALLFVDRTRLALIDKENPHPLLLQDVMRDKCGISFHRIPLEKRKDSTGK